MPFTFAHPAAVLPLKRFAPRWLSFPALLVGTVTPDLAYLFANKRISEVAHGPAGVFVFSLPAGLVAVWLLHWLGPRLIPRAPTPFQGPLLPLVEKPFGSVATVVCSLLIGAGTHVLWDSFTHKEGWLVQQFAFLQHPVPFPGHRTPRVCHLLWHLSTFAGMIWLARAYQCWRRAANGNPGEPSASAMWRDALLLAGLITCLGLVHHLFQESLVVGAASVVLMAWFVWRVETRFEQPVSKAAEPVCG